MDFLKTYGDTIGPLGFPQKDRQARTLEALLKALPSKDHEYRRLTIAKAPTELNPGERSDVSWITTSTPDRQGHVILPKGMNDSQFVQNPVVTLMHCYTEPPIGRSLWRKHVKDGDIQGVKAKTHYPPKPLDWNDPWAPDKVFSLIQSGLLPAKSIGLLPTKLHYPTDAEQKKNNWQGVNVVVDEWVLLEYSVGTLPINPDCLVESVQKLLSPEPMPAPERHIEFMTEEQVQKHIAHKLGVFDFNVIMENIVQDNLDRARGKI